MKKFFAITFLVLSMSLFTSALTAGAAGEVGQGVKLIVPLEGGSDGTSQSTSAGQYISKLYEYGIGLGALLALAMIVWGATQYTASAGFPSVRNDAKDRILGALFGLVLLLGAVVILNTIGVLKNGSLSSNAKIPPRVPTSGGHVPVLNSDPKSLANEMLYDQIQKDSGSNPGYQTLRKEYADAINDYAVAENYGAINDFFKSHAENAVDNFHYDNVGKWDALEALSTVLIDAKNNFSPEDYGTATEGVLAAIEEKSKYWNLSADQKANIDQYLTDVLK